jgi:RND family efflux transporter MFP subunit
MACFQEENGYMPSWVNRLNPIEFLNTTKLSVREYWKKYRDTHSQSAAVAVGGVRASVALAGLFLVLVSFGVAMGVSTPGEFRDRLYALVPESIRGIEPAGKTTVEAPGEIVAARELMLSSQASGRVTTVRIAVGEVVSEGSVIMRIDDTEARRVLRSAEIDLASAELELARIQSSPETEDQASSSEDMAAAAEQDLARQAAEIEVRRAESAFANARQQLSYYEIKAPFDGVVASLDRKVAQYVNDGDPVARLVTKDLIANVVLAQGEVARVRVGQHVAVRIEGSDVSVSGRVAEIGKGAKSEDGLMRFLVAIALPADERLLPGMQARVEFLEG